MAIFFIAIALILITSKRASAGEPAKNHDSDSVSVGTPMNGSLEKGEALPRRGTGYAVISDTQNRKARFGVHELVMLIKEASLSVQKRYRGSLLNVGDLSNRRGGIIDHHGSHQNGRDVDLLFYLVDKSGKPVLSHGFVPIDANGYSTDPPLAYRFDIKRNWSLVAALLSSKTAMIQWIFVSDNIKKILLDYAREQAVPLNIIQMAEQVLHQPGNKAHSDHFHVRVYCPKEDEPMCKEVGPIWEWKE